MTNSADRMTIQQIEEAYPNQWVGINNVEYEDDNTTVKAASVVYTDKTASELGFMALRGEDVQPLYTTPNDVFQLGALG